MTRSERDEELLSLEEEDYEEHGDLAAAAGAARQVTFDSTDTTTECPEPRWHVMLLPEPPSLAGCTDTDRVQMFLSSAQIIQLPHPRHGLEVLFLAHPDRPEILELQEKTFGFGSTWFIDNHVEPTSPMYIATAVDPTFFALALSRTGSYTDMFVSEHDVLHRHEGVFDALPQAARSAIASSLDHVCDVRRLDGDERFFRFSEVRLKIWFAQKVASLSASRALSHALGLEQHPDCSSTLRDKAYALLAEYIRDDLHGMLAAYCGVALTTESAPSAATGSHWDAQSRIAGSRPPESAREEPLAKRARAEYTGPKSIAVKRLEKAGPPKGTPTLLDMFAKKKQP
jgi:hypothetical protein